jgi:beta-mannosidase
MNDALNSICETGFRTIKCFFDKLLLILVILICSSNVMGDFESEMEAKHKHLQGRVEQLRKHYSPYLQSLPEPLEVRKKKLIDSKWLSKYEVKKATKVSRPKPPEWYSQSYDDSLWEDTSVPQWRYSIDTRFQNNSCILWYRTKFAAELPPDRERVFLVFEGVDWESEVWLNGIRLGSHKVYYEPFRFDVTSVLKKNNTLAVRVLEGDKYGEPAAYWAPFNLGLTKSKKGMYVRDKSKSLTGYKGGDSHGGTGYGIFRDVYLETGGQTIINNVFARAGLKEQVCRVKIELDAAKASRYDVEVKILPENFHGKSYGKKIEIETVEGDNICSIVTNMKGAAKWQPDKPCLYRCRVIVKDGDKTIDAQDVLFGYRSFSIVNKSDGEFGEGTFLLNGAPVSLRGTNIQGLNTLWFWSETDKLLDVILMLKTANFNSIRSCQHVQMPEVREYLDRLGMMSQQDNSSRYPLRGKHEKDQLVHASRVITRECYNNPGVVLISYANETHFDPTEMLNATMEVDPERIVVPISGHWHGGPVYPQKGKSAYNLRPELWDNVIESIHPYWGWYGFPGQPWKWCQKLDPDRKILVGEYGAEGLDNYITMKDNYPKNWPVYGKDEDVLFGHVQVKKKDRRQVIGLRGSVPSNLGEYIEASQIYQADICSEVTRSWRISSDRIAGYFHFHFIDVLACNWPKSLVSHDLRPKKAYFDMMQVNQPITPLFKLDEFAHEMEIWLANDLGKTFKNSSIRWEIKEGDGILASGMVKVDIAPYKTELITKVSIVDVPDSTNLVDIVLILEDSDGREISRYEKDVYIKVWRHHGIVLKNENARENKGVRY